MGWGAVTHVVGLPALLLYAGGIFWTLGYDTVYAHQDREDDMRAGIRSSALRLGAESRKWVGRFYMAAWLLFFAALAIAQAGWPSLLLMAGPAWHLRRQIAVWNPDDPESALAVFRSSRDCGLLVLAAAAF
jgi:4-hydroxybenzoate polyprenyltransferase